MYRHNDNAFVFQIPVYTYARDFVLELGVKSVLDVGCGNPQKLKAYILPFIDDITGIDLPDVVKQITETFGDWIGFDLDGDDKIDLDTIFNLIIVADVIEHLKNPVKLFNLITSHANESTIILISTPEKRDTMNNQSHKKEYTKDEMLGMLIDNGLCVEWSRSYIEKTDALQYESNVFLCKKKMK